MKHTKLLQGIGSRWKEILIGVLTIAAIYILGLIFMKDIVLFLRQFPFFENIYQLIMSEIARKSTIGLSIMTFIANLFIVTYPSEVLFFFYTRVGYNPFYISAVMTFWMMVAQAVNYGCGLLIEKKFIAKIIKENKKEFSSSIRRYDYFFIVLISALPLPGDLLSVFLGMIRYDFKKAMLYTFIGKAIKYIFLILLIYIVKGFWFLGS